MQKGTKKIKWDTQTTNTLQGLVDEGLETVEIADRMSTILGVKVSVGAIHHACKSNNIALRGRKKGCTRSASPRKVRSWARKKGYQVYRGGWPDFVFKNPDGKLAFVEVKGPNDKIRKNQRELLTLLTEAGLLCYVAYPVGKKIEFKLFDKNEFFSNISL